MNQIQNPRTSTSEKLRFIRFPRALMLALTMVPVSGALLAQEQSDSIPYTARAQVLEFTDRMASEHQYDRGKLESLFEAARYQQSIIDAISRPAEKRLLWWEYRKIFLTISRIVQGAEFWLEHEQVLNQISKNYQVDPEVIVAILGVETFYGQRTGRYRVMDSLTTLGFDYPPRSRFFRKELEQFLLLAREEGKDPLVFTGSYAGAMGWGQFIPSSFRSYAVDADRDGLRDIWNNPVDAMGSVANYLKRHGWREGAPVVHQAEVSGDRFTHLVNKGIRNKGLKQGATAQQFKTMGVTGGLQMQNGRRFGLIRLDEEQGEKFWLAEKNFFVITTYNTSRLYAMAVYDLSQAVRQAYLDAKGNEGKL